MIFLQAQASEKLNVLHLVLNSDPIVQFTLAVLIFFSVFSWAIIFMKFFQIKKCKSQSEQFIAAFETSGKLEDMFGKRSNTDTALHEITSSGLREITQARNTKSSNPGYTPKIDLDLIRRRVRHASDGELAKLELYTPFLATTASATPFIGLFGTVWGILTAFWMLKSGAGASSITVVGPYIAEALIATAVGLAAAIPAVMAYNYFLTKIRGLARDFEDFSMDLVRRIEQEYF